MPFQMSAVSAPLDRRARAHAALKACQALQQRRLIQVTGLLTHVWPQAQDAISYLLGVGVLTDLPFSAETMLASAGHHFASSILTSLILAGGMRLWGMLSLSVVAVTVVGAVAHWKGQRDALGKQPGSNTSLSSLDGAHGVPSDKASPTPEADRWDLAACIGSYADLVVSGTVYSYES